jgi:hypothetical protein
MLIKQHNTNQYVSIQKSGFANHSHYYQEIMRIQFNKVYTHQDPTELIQSKLNLHDKRTPKNKK